VAGEREVAERIRAGERRERRAATVVAEANHCRRGNEDGGDGGGADVVHSGGGGGSERVAVRLPRGVELEGDAAAIPAAWVAALVRELVKG